MNGFGSVSIGNNAWAVRQLLAFPLLGLLSLIKGIYLVVDFFMIELVAG